jgi:hypothetical protein
MSGMPLGMEDVSSLMMLEASSVSTMKSVESDTARSYDRFYLEIDNAT